MAGIGAFQENAFQADAFQVELADFLTHDARLNPLLANTDVGDLAVVSADVLLYVQQDPDDVTVQTPIPKHTV